MTYFSKFYGVDVRESIAKEFTDSSGEVDDMMAGLHEIRVRMAEKKYNIKDLEEKIRRNQRNKTAKQKVEKMILCGGDD